MTFVHLHNHTQYSLLDGANRVKDILETAKVFNMPALAITDHGNMFGVIDFYQTALEIGIKPIIGMEAYIINGKIESEKDKKNDRFHLTLLAKNQTGYDNLVKLTSISYLKGFYYKPRIDKYYLEKYSEGLIGLSGCMKGEVQQLLIRDKFERAAKTVKKYQEIFGENDFYIEIMRLGMQDEEKLIESQKKLALETKAKLVATNDCHYLHQSDATAHDVLLCIQTGKLITDEKRMKFSTDKVYFRSPEEMETLFSDIPEAIENTVKIADKCNLELDFKEFKLPKTPIPDGYESPADYLYKIVYDGAKEKYEKITPEIRDRIEYEFRVIQEMGFVGYFLITREIVSSSRKMGVMVGPGRGSAAGSIIAYLTDITRVDPLKYNLLFERFLNTARISMPDIDMDFSATGRNKVLQHILDEYGRKNVCQIVTFGSLGAKMVVRDVGRTMDIPLNEVNAIAKLIPSTPKITLKNALNGNSKLQKLINSKAQYRELMNYSQTLEGLSRHSGVHAAGVVIAPDNLMKFVPLSKNVKEDVIVTQYEGKWLDTIKMLKMDILGLKNLTVIEKSIELIKKNHGIEIDIDNIKQGDKLTYDMICAGETDGVFQFEGSGMREVLKKVKPRRIDDLAACTALYRPGPLGSGMHEAFIRRKNGKEEVSYPHPLVEKILKDTYGVIVYQEQVMQIAHQLAGFTLSEADTLRKAMSKKKKAIIAKFSPKFIKGAVKKGVEEDIAKEIYYQIKQFGQYGFNKSHSVAYSIISYQTAFLKANYPTEYMAALMSVENDNDKIAKFIDVCNKMGIKVESPDVNNSDYDFAVKKGKIYFGLKAIKNVGNNAANEIVKKRDEVGNFSSIYEITENIPSASLNKTTLECLIAAGAMDNLEGNRAEQFNAIGQALEYGANISKDKAGGQPSLFDTLEEDNSVKYPPLKKLKDWSISFKLKKEKELLGMYFSGHPLLKYKTDIDMFVNLSAKNFRKIRQTIKFSKDWKNRDKNKKKFRIIGLVNEVTIKRDKNNNEMAFVQAEDLFDKFEVIFFSSVLQRFDISDLSEDKILLFTVSFSSRDQDADSCKFIGENITAIDQLPKKLSGEISLSCKENSLDTELLNTLVNEYFKKNVGKFKLHFKINTEKFGMLDILSQKYSIYPTSELLTFVKNNEKLKMRIKLNEN
ncbi:MAG: DNA polymerase III subunit alpha [Candidatus Cloacimonadota bacterium]|nr:DNA polymerase III subunit alpha [Candidatus Cloacimonadota bacterium]